MTQDDKKRFAVIMHWLADRMISAGGQPRKLSQDDLRDYFNALHDIRIERIEWGAKHYFANNRFFPMPIDLRECAALAPSAVLPPPEVKALLPEVTPEQAARNLEKLNELLEKIDCGMFDA